MKEYHIIGLTVKGEQIIKESFLKTRKGLSSLALNRLLLISHLSNGAKLVLRDKRLSNLISDDHIITAIVERFPKELVIDIDYKVYKNE